MVKLEELTAKKMAFLINSDLDENDPLIIEELYRGFLNEIGLDEYDTRTKDIISKIVTFLQILYDCADSIDNMTNSLKEHFGGTIHDTPFLVNIIFILENRKIIVRRITTGYPQMINYGNICLYPQITDYGVMCLFVFKKWIEQKEK